jgi:hypothetical protein
MVTAAQPVAASEHSLPLAEALKLNADTVSISPRSAVRWIQRGVKGVKLQARRVGGRYFVSPKALEQFLATLNAPATHDSPRSPHERERASAEAARELTASGC